MSNKLKILAIPNRDWHIIIYNVKNTTFTLPTTTTCSIYDIATKDNENDKVANNIFIKIYDSSINTNEVENICRYFYGYAFLDASDLKECYENKGYEYLRDSKFILENKMSLEEAELYLFCNGYERMKIHYD